MRFGEEMDGDLDYDIDGIERETEKAVCVVIGGEEMWFPKSLCKIGQAEDVITIPEWMAKKQGLV